MLKDNLTFIALILLIIFFSYITPKALIILATPFVYTPQTFNENYVEIKVFLIPANNKIIMRANVTDQGGAPIDKVLLNLTDANGIKKYENTLMVNTSETCAGPPNCWIWEKNYTFEESPAEGYWTIDVYANDTNGDYATNSTTFKVYYRRIAINWGRYIRNWIIKPKYIEQIVINWGKNYWVIRTYYKN